MYMYVRAYMHFSLYRFRGYIVTAPAQLQMGGVERVCVTLHGSFDADEEFEINISLKKLQDSDTTYLSQSMVFFGSNDLNLTALLTF